MRRLLTLCVIAPLWLISAGSAEAATKTWAAAADGVASASGNWSPSGAPTTGDDVIFNGTSTKNCTSWDINLGGYNFGSFSMNSGYTGTVTLGIALPITNALTIHAGTLTTSGTNYNITAGSYTQDGGALTANGSTITVTGTWNQTAGTFTAGTSTVKIYKFSTVASINLGATSSFNNLTLGFADSTANTITITSAPGITVSGVLTVAESSDILTQDATNRTVTLSGNGTPLVTNSGTVSGVNTFQFTSTSSNTYVAATTYNHLTISGSGGTFHLGTATSQTLSINGDFTVSAGTVNASTYNPAVNLTGSLSLSLGVTYTPGTGTFTFNGTTAKTWTDSTASKQNIGPVSINKTDSGSPSTNDKVTLATAVKATSVTIDGTSGSADTLDISGYTLTLTGTGTVLTISGTLTENTSSTVEYAATSSVTTVAARTYAGSLKINGSGGNFSAGGNIIVNGDLIVSAGTFQMGINDLTVGTGSGTGNIYGAGTLSQSSPKTTTLKGTGVIGGTQAGTCSGTDGGISFYNLTVGDGLNTKTTTVCGTGFSLTGVLTIATNHTLDGGSATITNVSQKTDTPIFVRNGTFTKSTSTVQFTGAVSPSALFSANMTGSNAFYNLTFNRVNQTLPAGANIEVTNALYLNGSTLQMGASNLTVGTAAGTNTLLYGSTNITQTSGTTTFLGTGNLGGTGTTAGTCTGTSGSYQFYNLTLGDGLTAKTTYACGAFTVSGTLTVNASHTLDGGSQTITLSGTGTPFAMGGADRFAENTSTVSYTGDTGDVTHITVTGTTYYNLTTNSAAETFDAGGNITLTNDLNITAGVLDMGPSSNYTLTLNGNTTIDGELDTGTNTITFGNASSDFVNINNGGVLKIESDNTSTDIVRNVQQNHFLFNTGSTALYAAADGAGTYQIRVDLDPYYNLTINDPGPTGHAYTHSAASGITVNNNVTITKGQWVVGGTSTVSGSLTVNDALSLNVKTLTIQGGSLTGTGTVYCGNGNNTCGGGTVNITGTGSLGPSDATTTAYTFYDLNIGSGTTSTTTTTQGSNLTVTIAHQLTVVSKTTLPGNTLDGGPATWTFTKASNNQTTTRPFILGANNTNFLPSTSTVIYNSQTSGTICDLLNNSNTPAFYNLQLNASGATYHFTQNETVNGVLTIGSGATLDAETYTLTFSGSGIPFVKTGTFTASTSTVNYTGSAATTVAAATYNNLGIGADDSNAVTYTLGGATTVNATLTIGATTGSTQDTLNTDVSSSYALTTKTVTINTKGILTPNASTVTLTGGGITLTINGTFNPDTSTVLYKGTPAPFITGTTYYNLTLGDSSTLQTYTANGDLTVQNVLTIDAGDTLDASSYGITLTNGTNNSTPFLINGSFTPGTGTVTYNVGTSNTINVTGTTYNALRLRTSGAVSPTYKLAGNVAVTSSSATALDLWGGSVLSVPTLDTNSVSNYSLTVTGGVRIGVNFSGVTANITANGSTVTIGGNFDLENGTFTQGASTMTVSGSFLLDGTFTKGSGTVTLNGASKSWTDTNATIQDAGAVVISGTIATTTDVKATSLTVSSGGVFTVGSSTAVTTGGVTITGGTFTLPNSGGKLKLSGGGTLSMSSGTFSTSDVATPIELTTSDTVTPTYVGVSFTGGTVNVAELDVDYLKSTGFVIGSGVTLTALDQVRWGGSGGTWHGQGATGEVMLDITSKTASLLNHTFPTTWANQDSADCNVRSNTSLVVTMWDWSGAYGGENYDCDNSGGEVVWKGGVGGTGGGSGSGQYPAIY